MEELVSSFAGEEPVAMDETAQLFREDGSVLRTKNPKDGARIPSNDSVFAQWEAPGNTFLDGAGAGAEDDDADDLDADLDLDTEEPDEALEEVEA